jgi:oxygen-independent coproporphyrinogen-3 oxidase
VQNQPATAKYQAAARDGQLTAAKGHTFEGDDIARGRVIEDLLCYFRADLAALAKEQSLPIETLLGWVDGLEAAMPGTTDLADNVLTIRDESRPLARIIARHFDAYEMNESGHSQAV